MDSSFLVHSSAGLKLFDGGPKNFGACSSAFQPFTENVKFVCTSKNGKRIAWISGGEVHVVEAPNWKVIGNLKHPKAQEVSFSPQGSYIAVFDTYARNIGEAAVPNLSIYDVANRKLVIAYLHQTQYMWQPQWTADESFVARMQTSEVMFYEVSNMEKYVAKKTLAKVRSFSLSPSKTHHYCTFFVPTIKDIPAYVHLYRYPDFKDASMCLANKSFFKVDTVEFFWNPQCTAVLLLTTAPSDLAGTSYYGDQMLFYLNIRGDSTRVTFDKTGNIRSVCWCSSGKEFIAVYGSAPSRAMVFNHKCDPIKNFGDGARNLVMLNPPGNIAMIGAMGNISSRFEFWDLAETKLISQLECSDITHMEWSPCGMYLLTSTCAPRLRVNNGYRVFHYTSTLVHEFKAEAKSEVLKTTWLQNSVSSKPFKIDPKPIKGINLEMKTSSAKRYIPPSQRAAAKQGGMVDEVKRFLSEREQPSSAYIDPKDAKKLEKQKQKQDKKPKQRDDERGDWRKPTQEEIDKEKAEKLKKKKEGKKKKQEEKKQEEKKQEEKKQEEKKQEEKKAEKPEQKPSPEKEALTEEQIAQKTKSNRVKAVRKQLKGIEQLKVDKASGKDLLKGQLSKMDNEAKLLQELEQLTVS